MYVLALFVRQVQRIAQMGINVCSYGGAIHHRVALAITYVLGCKSPMRRLVIHTHKDDNNKDK